ncbi:hypothetical protein [Natronorubrum bangense]|uniref:Uncharacterized protein n=2 Tax=Natronorubrum bangense TaxID=61858 RepID=L9WK38_9EURY|nr:hypothetical protein [Natronorubrum bangense]ELY49762.1 hypothetical protein C494_07105 [Natronorubrum bangense JCM 10635]QCC55389.1 hypothetical protein DV706_13495 [Natronorubrum bangense]
MQRRSFLQTLATGGILLSADCAESVPFSTTRLDSNEVFDGYRYEDRDLVVEFHDDVDVNQAMLADSSIDEEYETVDHPGDSVRFPVVFPDRLESRVSHSLRVNAETDRGSARLGVGQPVHAYVHTVEALPDGRARLEIESQTSAPVLVGFVGIYGDVPNPTLDPQSDSFDHSSVLGPGVVGAAANRPLSEFRTDLVIPPEETRVFETTYAPFAFPDGIDAADCNGDERTGTVAVVHGSGGSAAYTFTYRLEGEPASLEDGLEAAACPDTTSASE